MFESLFGMSVCKNVCVCVRLCLCEGKCVNECVFL